MTDLMAKAADMTGFFYAPRSRGGRYEPERIT